VDSLTYRDLQARRELIRRRMEEHHRRTEQPRKLFRWRRHGS
jgi:hypothetical protein